MTVSWDSDVFKSVLGRCCSTDGTMFLRTEASRRLAFMNEVAAARHIPPRTDGKVWSGVAVMTPGDRNRLMAVQESLVLDGLKTVRFIDVTQDVGHRRASDLIPCLLTRSRIFAIQEDTFLTPFDAFCAQCLPVSLPEDSPFASLASLEDEVFYNLPTPVARQLAGNGMVMPCVGSVMMLALLFASDAE